MQINPQLKNRSVRQRHCLSAFSWRNSTVAFCPEPYAVGLLASYSKLIAFPSFAMHLTPFAVCPAYICFPASKHPGLCAGFLAFELRSPAEGRIQPGRPLSFALQHSSFQAPAPPTISSSQHLTFRLLAFQPPSFMASKRYSLCARSSRLFILINSINLINL